MFQRIPLRALWPLLLALCVALPAQSQTRGQQRAPAEKQDPQTVMALVEEFMLNQAETYPGAAQVSVEPPRITNQAMCHDLEVFLAGSRLLRSRMNVGVRCLGPESWTTYVQVNLRIDGFYYVTNRTINAGDVLSLDDLVAREGDILRLSRGTVFDPSQAIGFVAKQRIPRGTPVKATALRDPNSIERGQRVKTIARGPGFVITGEGQALEDGNPGSTIQVRSGSGQVITGVVVDATTVQIPM